MTNSKRLAVLAVALTVLVATGRAAHADDDKRPPQDYGAPAEETTAGDVVAWPIRVVLFPLWLVSEFLVRKPIGFLVQGIETGRWIQKLEDVFTVGHRQSSGGQFSVLPTVLVDVGMKTRVGFNAHWKYLLHDHNSARLHFATWGADFTSMRGRDTYELSSESAVFLEGSLVRASDNAFSGIGPFSRQDARSRYASTEGQVAIGHELAPWRSSAIRTRAGVRTLLFGDGGCCDEPTLREEVDRGRIVAPGFGRGYRAAFQRVELELDSRRPRPIGAAGFRVEAHEEAVFTVDPVLGEERRSWVKYGGSATGALDLTGDRRVVSLTVAGDLADPLSGTIPFPDLISLGGDSLMPGFLRGRLVSRSAAVASLSYRWPIWVYLDGVAHAAVGNVFGEHFSGFDVRSTRLSTGIGMRSNGNPTTGFELLFAVGSEPFDDQFKIDSFRFVLGTHHGF